MPNYENDWNRNRRSSNQDWNDDDNRNSRNRNYEDDNFDDRRNYGNRGNYSGSNRSYNQESNSNRNWGNNDMEGGRYSGNDYGDIGNKYGRSSGFNSRSNESDWNNRSNRGYGGSSYGNDQYSSDRNRNEGRDWWDKTKDEVSSWFGDDDAQRRRRMDEMRSGQHRGKGPRGYTRSDERIKEDVNDRLSDDPHIDASDIDVSVQNCEVTLTGTVNNRWEKRHAEDIVEALSGVRNVENRLRVSSGTNTGNTGNWGSTSSKGGESGSSGSTTLGGFDTGKS